MNELQNVFNYEGSEVRTVRNAQDVFFIAKDVCEVLDHSDVSVAVSRLDEDEKLTQTMFVSGQNRKVWLVNESGLYLLIMTSRKKEAKQFKRWITHEVLPAIRKHGAYMTPDTIEKALMARHHHPNCDAAERRTIETAASRTYSPAAETESAFRGCGRNKRKFYPSRTACEIAGSKRCANWPKSNVLLAS